MTEETAKELSIDELKEVSGGIRSQGGGYKKVNSGISAGAECDPDVSPDSGGKTAFPVDSSLPKETKQFIGGPILPTDIGLS
jgi:bacteriocin-like protein